MSIFTREDLTDWVEIEETTTVEDSVDADGVRTRKTQTVVRRTPKPAVLSELEAVHHKRCEEAKQPPRRLPPPNTALGTYQLANGETLEITANGFTYSKDTYNGW